MAFCLQFSSSLMGYPRRRPMGLSLVLLRLLPSCPGPLLRLVVLQAAPLPWPRLVLDCLPFIHLHLVRVSPLRGLLPQVQDILLHPRLSIRWHHFPMLLTLFCPRFPRPVLLQWLLCPLLLRLPLLKWLCRPRFHSLWLSSLPGLLCLLSWIGPWAGLRFAFSAFCLQCFLAYSFFFSARLVLRRRSAALLASVPFCPTSVGAAKLLTFLVFASWARAGLHPAMCTFFSFFFLGFSMLL